MTPARSRFLFRRLLIAAGLLFLPAVAHGQGVTTGAMTGLVTDTTGAAIPDARVTALHVPSGTQYRGVVRSGGAYTLPSMRVGGPYQVTVTAIGFRPHTEANLFVSLGENLRRDYQLIRQVVQLEELQAVGTRDEVMDAGRTGAATFIDPREVALLPSIKRSTRDLTRLDPRSDGNFAFAGRNWLYNNVSLDGSYFNNPYGLDDPAPGGQTNAEPVPFDAVEQVEVSVAPFDVREGGFTGANINTVTKSGTNDYYASLYTFSRTDALLGNTLRGTPIVAEPVLSFMQAGFSLSGPLIRDKLFFFANGEFERTDDPGTNFVASTPGTSGFGVSRVEASVMDAISTRLRDEYGYETGGYDGFIHATDNNKFLIKLDWNINDDNNLVFRYNYLDATRDLPPHPFAITYNNTGRGPNQNTLPFQNSGYAINNNLNSFALELNTRKTTVANRFFASFNRFRDFREPSSAPFPTLEIGQDGVTYTTVGHEPFSVSNILDQDVLQITNNLSVFKGRHTLTVGANFESFSFFNSFNIFRHGFPVFFNSVDEFFDMTDPTNPNQLDLNGMIGSGPFKGENIHVGQLSAYVQDEFLATDRVNLTYGVRVDFPMYFTNPVDNPFSRGLTARDETGATEVVDQSQLPSASPLFSPRIGFNWNAVGDRRTQIRGGTGIFTGRVPFVWLGNAISNPGFNPNLYPDAPEVPTRRGAVLQQSFDLNAIDPEFKWPQVWTTNLAVDQRLPWNMLGTLEVVYGNDLNAVFMRNADLVAPVRTLPDGRPYYGGAGNNELNPDGAGIYVLDNTSEGYSLNLTAQLRKNFSATASASLSYGYTQAENNLKSTEIASVLWQTQPVQGDPNNPRLGPSEFGQRHRIVGTMTYSKLWSSTFRTHVGLFFEVAEGNRFAGAGGNRYSFIYSGDVNGDGQGGNDLIYIPQSQSEILFDPNGSVSADQQWAAFNAFIEQDKYLRGHRGQIAERSGLLNPWYNNMDLRIMQDFALGDADRHNFQLSIDILNLGNLLRSGWGIRKVANVAATSPLSLVRFDATGAPVFNFTGPAETFVDDPGVLSRWRAQVGLRYFIH